MISQQRAIKEHRYRLRQQRIRAVRRRKRALLGMSAVVIIIIAVYTIQGSSAKKKEFDIPVITTHEGEGSSATISGNAGVRQIYVDELNTMVSLDARIETIINDAASYPEKVLKMLANNIETLDFVLDYQEKKERPIEESIGELPKEGEVPLLIQWDERWGYAPYGNSMVAVSGCGPTAIAMVASGLKSRDDITPYKVAAYSEENGFLTKEMDTSWDLMTYGCEAFGISGAMLGLDEEAMVQTLMNGHPIICSMGPGDFTNSGHFIVLTGYENGLFQVNDSNSRIRSEQGWSYEVLKNQIVNMWYYSLTEG